MYSNWITPSPTPQATSAAFAAIRHDGSVITWGDERRGGDCALHWKLGKWRFFGWLDGVWYGFVLVLLVLCGLQWLFVIMVFRVVCNGFYGVAVAVVVVAVVVVVVAVAGGGGGGGVVVVGMVVVFF